jgi:hypothetical protein
MPVVSTASWNTLLEMQDCVTRNNCIHSLSTLVEIILRSGCVPLSAVSGAASSTTSSAGAAVSSGKPQSQQGGNNQGQQGQIQAQKQDQTQQRKDKHQYISFASA